MAEHFINDGYGWECKHCREADAGAGPHTGGRARFFQEGEAEEREPRLSARALARWRDADAAGPRILYCPLCGLEEALREEG